MKDKIYTSLDELAEDFKPGEYLEYEIEGYPESKTKGQILGYVWGLPKNPGDDREPSLLVRSRLTEETGYIYTSEILRRFK